MFKLLLSILPFTVYGLPGSPADSMIQDQMVFGVRGQKKVADVQLAERETKTTFPLCADVRGASCSAVVEEKYLGAWYEQGRSWVIRNTFERNSHCVKATYSVIDEKTIKVYNTAVDSKKQKLDGIEGTATILAPGQLKVSFGDQSTGGKIGLWFQNLNKGPNYHILNVWTDANGEYKRALVTNGGKLFKLLDSIWILSRAPVISDADVQETLDYARKAGFNPDASKFERTPCSESERLLNP